MKCASCHDHFENPEWTQERFLGFAGLFAPHDLESIRCDVHSGQIVAGPLSVRPARAPRRNPRPARRPVAPGGAVDRRSGQRAVRQIDRQSVVEALPRARGCSSRSTIIGPSGASRIPSCSTWLARDFVAHGCDLKHTIRLILTSRTYQLPYEPELADRFDAANAGAPRYFRSPALRRLTAEQVIDSLRMATSGQVGSRPSGRISTRASRPWPRRWASPPRATRSARPAATTWRSCKRLELLNGPEIQELIDASPLVATAAAQARSQAAGRSALSHAAQPAGDARRKAAGPGAVGRRARSVATV